MSQRALSLPLRLASRATQSPSWTCRRCLATQAANSTAAPPAPSVYVDPRLPASARIDPATGRPAPLSETDRLLKKALRQLIPPQYLEHSTVEWLNDNEKAQRDRTKAHKKIVGVVVNTGKMAKTVKVRVPGQRWEPKIGKHFADHTNHLVHDPNDSLVIGDVVELHRLRVSKAVHHVIGGLVTPYGVPESKRPPIPTPDERLAAYKKKRFAKLNRRVLRHGAAKGDADATSQLKAMGLDPGQGVEAATGKNPDVQPSKGKKGKVAILGQKGQKLPEGVLPEGKHAVGKTGERAKHNKEKATNLDAKADANSVKARGNGGEQERRGVSADLLASATTERGRAD
ncbi:hypothetical protein LTR53_017406 [Teratosphaeriaceae sp. CCFEE 6253]|nr:hypothetical protein LTR53_017406 [Teratosphaeriaceae sp. CCFEE 6253]